MAEKLKFNADDLANAPMWAKDDTLLRVESLLRGGKGVDPKTAGSIGKLGKEAEDTTKKFKKFEAGIDKVVDGAGAVIGSLLDTSGRIDSMNPIVEEFSKLMQMGVKGLAGLLPIFGQGIGQLGAAGIEIASTMTQFLATELDEVASAYRDVASRGAVFAGNLETFGTLANRAGFGVENVGQLLDNLGPVLQAFGDSSHGAERALKNLASLREDQLYTPLLTLGYTVDGLAETAGDYYTHLVRTGRIDMLREGNEVRTAKLTAGYAKNLAVIARLTGRQIDDIKAEIKARQQEGYILSSDRKIVQQHGQEVMNVVKAASTMFEDAPELNKAVRMSLTEIGLMGNEFEVLIGAIPGAREALDEWRGAMISGTITPAEAADYLDNFINAVSATDHKLLLDMSDLSPYTDNAFVTAANQFVGSIVEFSANQDKSYKTAEDHVNDMVESSDGNIQEIITLEDKMRKRGLDAQLLLIQNVDTAAETILAINETFNELLTALVDPEIDFLDVLDKLVNKAYDKVKNFASSTITTAYQKIDNAIINATGGEDGWVSQGRENTKAVDDWFDKFFKATVGMNEKGEFIDAFKNEGGTVGYFQNLLESFQQGTPGVVDFGAGQLAMLHGKEAVIPAPDGNIPVDLGDALKPLNDLLKMMELNRPSAANLKTAATTVAEFNSVDTRAIEAVKSIRTQSETLEEMLKVLKYMADNSNDQGVIRAINKMSNNIGTTDLFRTA